MRAGLLPTLGPGQVGRGGHSTWSPRDPGSSYPVLSVLCIPGRVGQTGQRAPREGFTGRPKSAVSHFCPHATAGTLSFVLN